MTEIKRSARYLRFMAIMSFAHFMINGILMHIEAVERDSAFMGAVLVTAAVLFTGSVVVSAIGQSRDIR